MVDADDEAKYNVSLPTFTEQPCYLPSCLAGSSDYWSQLSREGHTKEYWTVGKHYYRRHPDVPISILHIELVPVQYYQARACNMSRWSERTGFHLLRQAGTHVHPRINQRTDPHSWHSSLVNSNKSRSRRERATALTVTVFQCLSGPAACLDHLLSLSLSLPGPLPFATARNIWQQKGGSS